MISLPSRLFDTPPPPESHPVRHYELVALGLILLVAGTLRLYGPDLCFFSLHTARDLYRTLLLMRGIEIPLLGSEMQYGGRVMGPLMYFLCTIPLGIGGSPTSVQVFIGILNTALLAGVWRFVRWLWGPGVALSTVALYAVFPLELANLRFNWNPSFLPIMTLGAAAGLMLVVVGRRPWHFVTAAVFISLGMQLHFSAVMVVPITLVVLILGGRRIPVRVWAAAIVVVAALFSPYLINELTSERLNTVDVVEANDSPQEPSKRWRFNPVGLDNYLYQVRLDTDEIPLHMGFTYLQIVKLLGPDFLTPGEMKTIRAAELIGNLQLLLWLAGLVVVGIDITAWWRRGRRLEDGEERERLRTRWLRAVYLAGWPLVPVAVLSFFSLHEPPTVVAFRYYVVTYPTNFITCGLGAVGIWRLAMMISARGPRLGVCSLLGIAGGLLVTGHLAFDSLYISLLARSGRFTMYVEKNGAPTLRSMVWVRDTLLGEAELDKAAYYERVHAQQLGDINWGEATYDYLISQDPRSLTNSEPDPHLRWLLHSPVVNEFVNSPEPVVPDGGTETRRWTLDNKGFTIVEYRVEDPDAPVPDNVLMRNFYFREVRMRYLGPDRELRSRNDPP